MKKSKEEKVSTVEKKVRLGKKDFPVKKLKAFIFIYVTLGTVLLVFSALLALVEPFIGFLGIAFSVCLFAYSRYLKKKINKQENITEKATNPIGSDSDIKHDETTSNAEPVSDSIDEQQNHTEAATPTKDIPQDCKSDEDAVQTVQCTNISLPQYVNDDENCDDTTEQATKPISSDSNIKHDETTSNAESVSDSIDEQQNHTETSTPTKDIPQDCKSDEDAVQTVQCANISLRQYVNDDENCDDAIYLAYEYDENIAYPVISLITGNCGKFLDFVPEPDNPYDEKAISIYLGKNKIGYLHRGRKQNMIIDWLNRDETVVGFISKVDVENNTASIKLGFYKSVSILPHKSFKLTKIKKKADEFSSSRYENIGCCFNGEEVDYEVSLDSDNYIITNDFGDEIGELSGKAVEFIDENEDKIKFLRINNIEETESGGYKADIEIFYSK